MLAMDKMSTIAGLWSFFDRYFHIPLTIVTKHELGLPFFPKEAFHKI